MNFLIGVLDLYSACKKTAIILLSLTKNVKDEACEGLKIKEFTVVNDCFQIEYNEVFVVFLQRLYRLVKKLVFVIALKVEVIDIHII